MLTSDTSVLSFFVIVVIIISIISFLSYAAMKNLLARISVLYTYIHAYIGQHIFN